MLVNKFCPHPLHSFPDLIIQVDGTLTHCPHTITKVFGAFYCKFYNCLTPENSIANLPD